MCADGSSKLMGTKGNKVLCRINMDKAKFLKPHTEKTQYSVEHLIILTVDPGSPGSPGGPVKP